MDVPCTVSPSRGHATLHWGPCYAAVFPPEIMPAANAARYAGTDRAALRQFGDGTAVLADEIVQSVSEYLRLMSRNAATLEQALRQGIIVERTQHGNQSLKKP
jgi:hypothetical protein